MLEFKLARSSSPISVRRSEVHACRRCPTACLGSISPLLSHCFLLRCTLRRSRAIFFLLGQSILVTIAGQSIDSPPPPLLMNQSFSFFFLPSVNHNHTYGAQRSLTSFSFLDRIDSIRSDTSPSLLLSQSPADENHKRTLEPRCRCFCPLVQAFHHLTSLPQFTSARDLVSFLSAHHL